MKRALNLVLSLTATVVCSWYAFRDADWSSQWVSLRHANYWWLVPYLAILLVIHLCRTLRWGALLSGLERVPFRALNESSSIGFMMLIVLPFRLGEFARPFLIANRSGIRRSPAMATVVVERIVDGILVALLLRGLMFFIPQDAPNYGKVLWASNVMFAIFLGGLVFLLFAYWQQARAVRLIRAFTGWISTGLADKAAHMVEGFVGALRQLPSRRQVARFFLLTLTYWVLNAGGMMIAARAFASEGNGWDLTLFQAFTVMCTLVVGVMIPSAPGMVGTFQAGIKFGLGLFLPAAVVNAEGLAFANVVWLIQTSQQIGLGLLMMSLGHLSFSEIAGKLAEQKAEAKGGEDAARVEEAGPSKASA
ncbi:MAG: flippase-like domain-containing protein [Myxococcota bacterium]|nr:flippase-like domain-containing protein [Myxococcota bacterium]